jgi:hypothetical protein
MTRHAVVDTNVVLVANRVHPVASPKCVIECVERLQELMKTGVLVIDDDWRILQEYQNKTTPRKAKGVGDLFVQWALRHAAQNKHVQQVPLTEQAPKQYSEFPDDAELSAKFDPSDRMFAAVAYVSSHKTQSTPIWQATDCKWLDWWPALKAHGVEVEFLCPEDVCCVYIKKFPRKIKPQLP